MFRLIQGAIYCIMFRIIYKVPFTASCFGSYTRCHLLHHVSAHIEGAIYCTTFRLINKLPFTAPCCLFKPVFVTLKSYGSCNTRDSSDSIRVTAAKLWMIFYTILAELILQSRLKTKIHTTEESATCISCYFVSFWTQYTNCSQILTLSQRPLSSKSAEPRWRMDTGDFG